VGDVWCGCDLCLWLWWVGDEESKTKKDNRQSLKIDRYSTDPMMEVIECVI